MAKSIREFIKFEKLSSEIRTEIQQFHETELNKSFSVEEAMTEWFDNKFEQWLNDRFIQDGTSPRRKHFRLNIELSIEVVETLIESTGEEDEDVMKFVGSVVNISKGGLYFKYHKDIKVSSIIKALIDLSQIDRELKNIEALAMVVHSDKIDDNSYGIGVLFSSIYDSDRKSLDLFILKNIAYHI